MPGILTISKKEFTDHVSDRTFLLSFVILLVAMVAGAFYQVQWIQDWTVYASTTGREFEKGWKYWDSYFTDYITSQLSSLGVLVAIGLSFNSINKERMEGSLKVLLSYPIYRDQVILGKLVAGVIVVSLVVIASMTISFSIVMFHLAIPLTVDFLLRIATVTAMGIMLLTFFLCVGTAISTVLRDTSAILVSLLLIATILRYEIVEVVMATAFNILSYLGVNLGGSWILGYRGIYRLGSITVVLWRDDTFYRNFSMVSPVETFLSFSAHIFSFQNNYSTPWYTGFPLVLFGDRLFGNMDLVAVQMLFAVTAFVVCYVLFTRRDIS